MKKKILVTLLTLQTVSFAAEDATVAVNPDASAYGLESQNQQPMFLDTPESIDMDEVSGTSSKGFLQRIFDAISAVFHKIVSALKNLFTSKETGASVESVEKDADTTSDVAEKKENTDEDTQESDDENTKMSSILRPNISLEPNWIQNKS